MKIYDEKWIEINGLSSGQFSSNNNIRFKTLMLRSDLYGYNIAVKGTITIEGDDDHKHKIKR